MDDELPDAGAPTTAGTRTGAEPPGPALADPGPALAHPVPVVVPAPVVPGPALADPVPVVVPAPVVPGPALADPMPTVAPAPVVPAREGDDGDSLPAELDVTAYVGQYTFPDIRRRRWPGYVYLLVAAVCFLLWATRGDDAVLVNAGMLGAAVALLAIGAYHLAAAWPLSVPDGDALVAAARQVGFPVGHASAQLGWRGLRSRPTWRILLYSNEDPPKQRGLVLVDGVDGGVIDHFVEDNPEDWAQFDT